MPVIATPGWMVPSHVTANRMFGTQAFSDMMAQQGILAPVIGGGGVAPPAPPAPTKALPPPVANELPPPVTPPPSGFNQPTSGVSRPVAPPDQMAPIKEDDKIQAAGSKEARDMGSGLTREKMIDAGEGVVDTIYRATLGYKRKRLLGE